MATQILKQAPKVDEGSGGLGSMLGAIGGLVAAPFTGGLSLAAIPGAMATGAGIGGTLGGMLDPGSQGKEVGQVSQSNGAISRKLAAQERGGRLKQLREAAMATASLPQDVQQQYQPKILEAYYREAKGGQV